MCVYNFHVQHLRPLVAFVGAHGATDLTTRHWPPIYAACCLTPLPPRAVTALFVVASLVHFAEDGGPDGSLALHALAGFAWLWLGAQLARRRPSQRPTFSGTRSRITNASCAS